MLLKFTFPSGWTGSGLVQGSGVEITDCGGLGYVGEESLYPWPSVAFG